MRPPLKILVAEVGRALPALKADRLEHRAHTCDGIGRDFSLAMEHAFAREPLSARKKMAALAKMLEDTRVNAAMMERIRMMRMNRLECVVVAPPESNLPNIVQGLD